MSNTASLSYGFAEREVPVPYTAAVSTSEGAPFSLYVRRAMPEKLSEMPAKDLLCKHTWNEYAKLSPKARALYDRAGGACQWSCDDGSEHDMKHLNIIDKMMSDGYENAVRLVVVPGRPNDLFADNLHTLVAWLRRFGPDAVLGDIPFYVVDIAGEVPFILTDGNMFRDSIRDCQGTVQAAMRYAALAPLYWPAGANGDDLYRVGDLLADHPMLLRPVP